MKKKVIFLLLFLSGSSIVFAQTEKGRWLVAGYSNLGLDIGKNKYKSGGTTTENYKYSTFSLQPEAGYFVTDKLAAGLFVDFYRSSNKYDGGDKDFSTMITVGPFIRYYLLDYKGFWPYAEGRVGFGLENYTNSYNPDFESKYTFFTTKLGAGTTYFVTERFGFDIFMGYDYDAWTDKTVENASRQVNASSDNKDKFGSFEMNIGVVLSLGTK